MLISTVIYQGKNTEVVCNSLLQWITFCQTSPTWPTHLGWPHTVWLSFIELDKAVVRVLRLTSFLWLWFQCDRYHNDPFYRWAIWGFHQGYTTRKLVGSSLNSNSGLAICITLALNYKTTLKKLLSKTQKIANGSSCWSMGWKMQFCRGLQDRCAGITVLQFNTYWAHRCASDLVYHWDTNMI